MPKFALALRKVGLKIDPADLKKTVRPYMEESKDKCKLSRGFVVNQLLLNVRLHLCSIPDHY